MKVFSLIFSITICSNLFAQDIDLYIKWNNKEMMIQEMNSVQHYSLDTTAESNNSLAASLKLENYTVEMVFKFDTDSTLDFQRCIYQTVIFDCTCAQYTLENLLESKAYGWVKIGSSQYLSNYYYQTKLRVHYLENSKNYIKMEFSYVNMPKKSFKKLYKTQKNK
jgi:hypothetical protein